MTRKLSSLTFFSYLCKQKRTNYMEQSFRQLLRASFKSEDTEEWLDVYFTRPIGLAFALFWNKFDVHPNTITILSMFLGAAAGWMFHYTDLASNLWGVLLLVLANFCDSTDGQMARLTGKKTLLGRMLDGLSADVWFFCIYLALVIRLWNQPIPGLNIQWGFWGLGLGAMAGFLSHTPQCALADYYRQIHLFFLLGKEGSELDSYKQQREIYESLPKSKWLDRLFYLNYANYCHGQERRTPHFQRFFAAYQQLPEGGVKESTRQAFLEGSRPLMKYTNMLTHNTRATVLFITACLNCPWIYMLFEVIVLNLMMAYMHRTHENLCKTLLAKL